MRAWVVSRLAQTVLVVFLSAVFLMARLGGDPVLLFMPMDIQARDVEEFRERLGFHDPLAVQYARFMASVARGDFGESLRYRQDALGLVLERLPATLLLAATAMGLTLLVAVPLGVLSAIRRNSVLDHGLGLRNIILSLSAAGWVVYARVVRGEVLSIKQRDYVHAAAALGVGRTRLLLRHVLPNAAPSSPSAPSSSASASRPTWS